MARIGVLGYSIPAPAYLAGIRLAKQNPEATFKRTLHSYEPGTGAEIIAQYRRDLHKRINERGGIAPLDSRINRASWSMAATPRVVLNHHTIRNLNRHQRPRLIHRARAEF